MVQHTQLLERLAQITSHRDLKRLEISLLKTLNELFHPLDLLFARMDNNQQLLDVIRYSAELTPLITLETDQLSEETNALIRLVIQNEQAECLSVAAGGYMTAIPASGMGRTSTCLIIHTSAPLGATDQSLIKSFFHVYKNFCLLLEDAQTDELTGLLNRKTFDESFRRINNELIIDNTTDTLSPDDRRHALEPSTSSYWIALIDIDHFKRVNDTFGHIYGDEVLILMSRIMERCFRSQDLLFRFGGEEFVVIAHCGDIKSARVVFERLRQQVAHFDFPQIGQVTISLGAVQMQPHSLASMLLDQADQALYFAKQHGRNQVRFHNELVEQQLISNPEIVTGTVDLF